MLSVVNTFEICIRRDELVKYKIKKEEPIANFFKEIVVSKSTKKCRNLLTCQLSSNCECFLIQSFVASRA